MMDEKTALEICRDHIPMQTAQIARCGVGHGNYVYIISCETGRYVIRCSSEDDAYTDTIYWLKQLRQAGIPVPSVIAGGKHRMYSYILLSYLDGEDLGIVYPKLSREEKRVIAGEVVEIQNKAASIELKNIGSDWTWNTFIQYMLDRAEERIGKNRFFDTGRVARLREIGGALQDYFRQIRPAAYLDDISTKNLLIKDGRVSGIIDVDWIGVGDRLTYAALSNVALRNMDCDTEYIDFLLEEMAVSQTGKKAFLYYSLLYCVDFMGERGMQFGDKQIDVNDTIIRRLNRIYDELMAEWDQNEITA